VLLCRAAKPVAESHIAKDAPRQIPSNPKTSPISPKQLVGSWIFVSAQDVKPDGSKVDPWGPNAKGAAMFDANGRFTFMIMQ
jgi:hypothetical protein